MMRVDVCESRCVVMRSSIVRVDRVISSDDDDYDSGVGVFFELRMPAS